jgi:hypothetical protein
VSRLVFSLPIELPEDADPVRLGAVFLVDVRDRAHLWVDSVPAAVAAFVCLARSLRDDEDAAEDVRHVAAGVFAALGTDVPTDPGVAVPPGRTHQPGCDCGACAEWRRGG